MGRRVLMFTDFRREDRHQSTTQTRPLMNTTFDTLYRQLGRTTLGLLLATLSVYGLTLLCALLGFADAVISLRGVAGSLAYVFAALLSLFLVSSVVAAVIRWIERRNQLGGSSAV